jgi:hypothetical protein
MVRLYLLHRVKKDKEISKEEVLSGYGDGRRGEGEGLKPIRYSKNRPNPIYIIYVHEQRL